MEQKLDLDILDKLLKKRFHARALAEKLGTNHMTVSRKLMSLLESNVLDYEVEGRNRLFFIKKSIEARNWAMMTELHRLNRLLGEYPQLRNTIDYIQSNKDVRLAILFGSYAKGIAKKGSDIDLYVETDDKKLKNALEKFSTKLSVKIGEFDRDSLLIKEIEKNHVIVKGVERYYDKVEFFKKAL